MPSQIQYFDSKVLKNDRAGGIHLPELGRRWA